IDYLAERQDELGSDLVAAMAALLHRYSERSQLVVGYVSGAEDELHPIPVQVSGDLTFAELLERVRATFADPSQEDHDAHPTDAVVAIGRDPAGSASQVVALRPAPSRGAGSGVPRQ